MGQKMEVRPTKVDQFRHIYFNRVTTLSIIFVQYNDIRSAAGYRYVYRQLADYTHHHPEDSTAHY